LTQLSSARLHELLDRIRGTRALVVGDLMLDRYLSGRVERISPEAPVPVVRVERESWAVGGAANVAANVLALGARCSVVGCVGADSGGAQLRRALEEMGGGVEGIVEAPDRPTTVKTRVLARSQQVVRFDQEDDREVSDPVAEQLHRTLEAALEHADVLILEDYNKGVLVPSLVRAAIEGARRRGIPSVVDPKRRHFFGFAGVTLFKPNAKELEEAIGEPLRPSDPEWMAAVRDRLACDALLLTLGEEGMALSASAAEYLRIPALARSVYDVSGAGDTVTAIAATTLAVGGSLREAALLANQGAAIEVGKAGVATVTPAELVAEFERRTGPG